MSAQVCPVCGGKGLVPKGFYDVSSNLSTTSATPETCRSCGGKGYIIVTPDPNHFIANTFNCSNCDNNDRMCYTSNPPQYKCTVDNTFHFAYDSCDKYKTQETGQTFTNVSLLDSEDMKLNCTSTNNTIEVAPIKGCLGCFTCANNDHRTYVSINDDGVCTDRYRCILDYKKYPRHHCCSEYKNMTIVETVLV